MMITRRWVTAIVLLFAITGCTSQRQPSKPNIILIVADDLGYADLGCQGSTDLKTPNIDSIARAGVRFTNGYVSCPVCSPTRAGLLTGRYQQRFGHEFNLGATGGLPVDQITIAQLLKENGYATGMIGKWHLGDKPQFHPQQRGFDEFFGFLAGSRTYYKTPRASQLMRGTEPVEEPEYLTDAFAREAAGFVDRHRAEPFFLYLPFNAVHTPLDKPPQKYLDRFANIEDQKRRTMAAMLSAMDDAVGGVLQSLQRNNIDENTLVIFISDNGGPTHQNMSRNTPLRGIKGQVYEGGIRVPFMMKWPKRLAAGVVNDSPVIALDILPTALAAAGAPASKTDGVNLAQYLKRKTGEAPHDALFWRYGDQWAIRQGNFKLCKAEQVAPPRLYDLQNDIGETTDVAASFPRVAQRLEAKFNEWNAQLEQPRWPKTGSEKALEPEAMQRSPATRPGK
jgi:arylsulfatase A-like enzyme